MLIKNIRLGNKETNIGYMSDKDVNFGRGSVPDHEPLVYVS